MVRLLRVLACLVAASSTSEAQDRPRTEPAGGAAEAAAVGRPLTAVPRITQVFVDNDLFALRDSGPPTDLDYTHGMGVTVHWSGVPAAARRWLGGRAGCPADGRLPGAPCHRLSLGARQAIFTPASNEDRRLPGERPHAGYLAVHAAVTRVTARRQVRVRAELGTTGQPALAVPLQKAMHYVTGSSPQRGWQFQLGARPVLDVAVDDAWQFDRRGFGAFTRLSGRWGAQVGTLRAAALAEGELLLAADRVRLWLPPDGGAALPRGPFATVAVRQEVVARDLFVDGHFGDRSITTRREPAVWQVAFGLGWRFAGGMTEYRHVRRGREYAAQPGPHSHGSLRFTWYHP